MPARLYDLTEEEDRVRLVTHPHQTAHSSSPCRLAQLVDGVITCDCGETFDTAVELEQHQLLTTSRAWL